jgi:pyrroloquinoline-quinone synthase
VGGIEKWIQLAQATGVDREIVKSCDLILPAVRFAVDAYIHLVSEKTMIEAVASSLTELFSKDLITLRVGHLNQHYPWLKKGLAYFEGRMTQAPEDAAFAVKWAFENSKTREEQELAIGALRQKCDILWAQLDAIYYSYVNPGWPPPGAFKISESK